MIILVTIDDFKFIGWLEFGELVEESKGVEPSVSMKHYAELKRYNVENRLGSAVKELLALAKLYQFSYDNTSSPVLFTYDVLDAIFTTVIISAKERDLILQAQSGDATSDQKTKALHLMESIMLPDLSS
ncbi:hypothetical protein L4D20_04335 [Vibrio kyushuensis]|uniref:hypothetical protein n=1 Tax=Vibrio kyushuensis TaxID=2910249 RepID=UPI003D09DFFD